MAGDDEARAREVLAEMQLRISQGATSALGIGEIVTADEVRAAFLQLTKQFHPARFGRMSPEVQRLANEVFLGIKTAHDHMLRVLGAPPRGGTSRASAPVLPMAEGTQRTAQASQSIPRVGNAPSAGVGRASAPVLGQAPRASTPPLGVPVDRANQTTSSIPRVRTPVPPDTQPGIGAGSSPPRAFTPVPPGTQPGVTPNNAASSSQRIPRIAPIAPPTQPPTTPPTQPPSNTPTTPSSGRGPVLPVRPAPESFNPPTVRDVKTPPPMSQPLPKFAGGPEPFDEAAAFREAAALMERKDWAGARQALHALAARVPQSATYRAWLHYARGREAYLGGQVDDAILEMQRALQLEPDLAHAKHALAELQRRR